MFRITGDPSSGSFVQGLAKIIKNGSIVSVDMDVVGFMAAYSARGACVYFTVQGGTIHTTPGQIMLP